MYAVVYKVPDLCGNERTNKMQNEWRLSLYGKTSNVFLVMRRTFFLCKLKYLRDVVSDVSLFSSSDVCCFRLVHSIFFLAMLLASFLPREWQQLDLFASPCNLCAGVIFPLPIYWFISLVICVFFFWCHCRWSVQNARNICNKAKYGEKKSLTNAYECCRSEHYGINSAQHSNAVQSVANIANLFCVSNNAVQTKCTSNANYAMHLQLLH